MPNRLASEVSPYLLQHAHNPVDWYPWGDEAFAHAREADRPVFLSIGYSACHWCHVMERESFESDEIAGLLNAGFVAIKVDREERPDVDSIYMSAVQMMTGHGGWPMSVFLTPDGRPFFAGTYFPPDDRHGLPSFRRVLEHVNELWTTRRDAVEEASSEVRDALQRSLQSGGAGGTVDRAGLDEAAQKIAAAYDPRNGGFGGAPKFPPAMALEFLMQVSQRTGDERLTAVVVNTLVKMARGGIYDQLGGGFHRYSVDERWLVPHFEKMLYDNALLARVYTHAWQWMKEPFFARIATETLDFVVRELTSPEGGFHSTLDADSEGEEGKFYVWNRSELTAILGEEDARAFAALYDVTDEGNWEGRNILNMPRDVAAVAAELGTDPDQLAGIAVRARQALYAARSKRIWPGRDDKILAGWNGWMLGAFAEAAIAFGRDDYREIARRNAGFLLTRIDSAGRLVRHARIGGLLEDYAGVAWGLTLAWEATGERRFLESARALADQMLQRFTDPEGGFYDTPEDHERLITRPRDLFDNATPAGNSVAADVLLRLALLFADERYARAAAASLERTIPLAQRYPSGFGFFLTVAEWRAGQPSEISIAGPTDDPRFGELLRIVGEEYLPHRVLVAGSESSDLPLMENRASERPIAYVCVGYACQEPTDDPSRLREQLTRGPMTG
ncbi:MAG: thioredoxin domain-containing protein [Thermoanaerobaculia bacterium]